MMRAAMTLRRFRGFGVIALSLWFAWHAAAASAQCCGDCDLDGSVSIAELVGGVKRAFDGCDVAPRQRVSLAGLQGQSIAFAMDRATTEGRLAFSVYNWSSNTGLFLVRNDQGLNHIGLVIDDDVLRLFVRGSATGLVFPGRYDLEQRLSGPARRLTIEAAWRPGKLSLTVDGTQVLRDIPSDIVFPADTLAVIGGGSPQSAFGAVFSDLTFSTD